MAEQQPDNANGAAAPAQPTGAQFSVEKIYVKDVSFESPKAPQVFNEQAQPQLNMNLNQRVQKVGENGYEVVLGITLTCTLDEGNTVYVAEVQQAGVFGLSGFEPQVLDYVREDSVLEREPLEKLARDGQLRAFRHTGFWDCMDTYKDAVLLNDLWEAGRAPWKESA
jgi:hypothetical protein